MLDVKKNIWKKALQTTAGFENGKNENPYIGMVGNFDGMYLSYGLLSWNFGTSTLQNLFLKLFNNYPQIAQNILPNGGKDLLNALKNGTEKQWALTIQKNNIIIDPWKTALINLGNTLEFQGIQDDAVKYYKDGAVALSKKYNLTTDRAFCLFFDIAVQNGSIRNFTMTETQYVDKLKSIAIAVSKQSSFRFQADVLSRKMAIVNGGGSVHGDQYTFTFDDKNAIINIDDATVNSINNLVSKKIISSPQYWIENTSIGDLVEGEFVAILMRKIAANVQSVADLTLDEAVKVFVNKGIINNPDYWLVNAIKGNKINGEYLAIIIKKSSFLIKNLDLDLLNAVNALVAKGIVNSPQYWLDNTIVGSFSRGDYIAILIQKSAAIIANNPNISLVDAINLFSTKKIIGTPQYWIDNAQPGKQINGEYLATVIKEIVKNI